MANTTWSTTDKSAGITLSGGNLTATTNGTLTSVRTADRQTSGKYYFEMTATNTAVNDSCGVISGVYPLGTIIGSSGATFGSAAVHVNTAALWVNGVSRATSFTIVNGSVICFALDLDNALLWVRVGAAGNWNGSAGNAPGGAGGVAIPFGPSLAAYPAWFAQQSPHSVTANFGDTTFAGSVPSGYTPGFTTGSPPTSSITTLTTAEQWLNTNPAMQASQVLIEQWLSVQTQNPQMIVTSVLLEQWMSVAEAVTAQQARAVILA